MMTLLIFCTLALLFCAFIFIHFLYTPKSEKIKVNDNKINPWIGGLMGLILLFCIPIFFYKYLNPDIDVYTNSAHHVVQLDGVELHEQDGFILAANAHAFFDNPEFQGRIELSGSDDKGVNLVLEGFTQGFYKEIYDSNKKRDKVQLLNTNSLLRVNTGDTLRLISNRGKVYDIFWEYYYAENPGLLESMFQQDASLSDYLDFDDGLKCRYMVKYNGIVDTLSYDKVVKKAIGLNTIYAQNEVLPSLVGCNLLRPSYNEEDDKNNLLEKWNSTPFYLEVTKRFAEQFDADRILVVTKEGEISSYAEVQNRVEYISVPFGQEFSISVFMGSLQTKPMRFVNNENIVCLEYIMPQIQYLSPSKKEGDKSVWIMTSVSNSLVDNMDMPDDIILFDLFYGNNNIYNIKNPIEFVYLSAQTNKDATIQVWDNAHKQYKRYDVDSYVEDNMTFSVSEAISWKIKVCDFKDAYLAEENIVSFAVLFLLALGWAFCCFLLRERKLLFLHFGALVLFVVVEIFFVVRLFLLWRTAVFPPVEMITTYEFHHIFHNESMMYLQLAGVCLFYIGIVDVLWFLLKGEKYIVPRVVLLLFLCALIISGISCFDLTIGMFFNGIELTVVSILLLLNIVALVVSFFYPIENIISLCKKGCNGGRFESKSKIIFYVLLVLIPLLSWTVSFVGLFGQLGKILFPVLGYFATEYLLYRRYSNVEESHRGFILSLVFGFLYTGLFLVRDGGYGLLFFTFYCFGLVFKLAYLNPDTESKWRKPCLLIIGLIYVFLVVFFSNCLEFLYSASYWVRMMLLTLVLLVVFGLVACSGIFKVLTNKKGILIMCVASILLGLSLPWALDTFLFKNHTEQRIIVRTMSREEGLLRTTDEAQQNRFFQASINDYILDVYNKVGQEKESYFTMQQHSRIGAMYGAQASDILVARFIHAEHNRWIPLGMLCMFVVMILVGVNYYARSKSCKMLLIQIPALLFIHALFVWLTNMRLFVFLGQDFPLLSLHSKLTIMYFFILLLCWFILLVMEYMSTMNNKPSVDNRNWNNVLTVSVLLLLTTMVAGYLVKIGLKSDDSKTDIYSMETILEDLDRKIDQLNPMFADMQTNAIIKQDLSDVSAIVQKFNKVKYDEIKSTLGGDSAFEYRMWEKFVTKEAKSNSGSSLIHVRKVHNADGDEKLKFDVRIHYFDKRLPTHSKNQWTGNVVSQADYVQQDAARPSNAYKLPVEWCKTGSDEYIVYSEKDTLDVINNNKPRYRAVKGDYSATFRTFHDDRHVGGPNKNKNYIARNLVINGKRTFVYPMKEEFFWAYTLAEELLRQRNDSNDIVLTIDKELNSSIYAEIKKKNPEKYLSVIVANGNGEIKSMVDYEKQYELDPNNRYHIAKLDEQLYLDYDVKLSDGYFGDRNLLIIPGGPGSTQKPMVWTAVASRMNYDWENLNMSKYTNNCTPNDDSGYYTTQYFGGLSLHKTKDVFRALASDENMGNGVSLAQYMCYSSNYYNAMMLYLGMHKSANLKSNTNIDSAFMNVDRRLLQKLNQKDFEQHYFPLISTEKDKLYYLQGGISRDYRNSHIYMGLRTLFGMNKSKKPISISGRYLQRHGTEWVSPYAFAQTPIFGRSFENNKMNDIEYAGQVLHQTAVGGQGTWEVTPLFMAQSFGRLVSLNSNYNLSIVANKNSSKTNYVMYDKLTDGYKKARKQFLTGMHNIFTVGTAKGMSLFAKEKEYVKKYVNAEDIKQYKGYYIYGKTGTSNDPYSKHTSLHRLGIVITNQPVHILEVDENQLKDVKFYTVYFTAYKADFSTYKNVLDKIIESESFKKYMADIN